MVLQDVPVGIRQRVRGPASLTRFEGEEGGPL